MNLVTRFRPTRMLGLAVLALAATLALGGCGSATATPKPSLGPIDLEGTEWVLLNYMDATGAVFTVPMAVTPTAKFSSGQFSGFAGCNTFSGPFTQEGDTIHIGPLAGTKVACDEPLTVVEIAYVRALELVNTARAAGDTLLLNDSDGNNALEFTRASN